MLDSYAAIPISFVIHSRLDLDQLWLGQFVEVPVDAKTKDYDTLESIATLRERFDTKNWILLSAHVSREFGMMPLDPRGLARAKNDDMHLIGGAILAMHSTDLDMLENRDDLAVMWDIRVHPLFRRQGLGAALFDQAKTCAKSHGCNEMRVETQDTNVDACRFYRRMGCLLHSIQEDAYEGLDEAKIIWTTRA